jgi:hypothetical protein
MYIEIYEVLWNEAVRFDSTKVSVFSSQKFQRIFFDLEEAKQFEQKHIKSGLRPELKIHKMSVKGGSKDD